MSTEEDNMQDKTISEGDVIENVHISPIGDFNGSDSDGNPVQERIDKESLEALADKLNAGDEVLFDTDHQSARAGEDRNTRAAGWFSSFFVDPVKGLFGKLKLTKWGKELISGREYRYVSPTFGLDENGKPVDLYSIAATNKPAFAGAISPILNQAPAEEGNTDISTKEQEISNMDILDMKKELFEELLEELHKEVALISAFASKKADEASSKAANEESACAEGKEAEAKLANAAEPAKEEEKAKAEEAKAADPAEEAAAAEPQEKAEEEEVIKLEALNSSPKPSITDEPAWKKLYGKDFIRAFESGKLFD